MKALVTGAAGFIGYHLSKQLLDQGWTVVGLDNLNPYYSVALKMDRLRQLQQFSGFHFEARSLEDFPALDTLFREHGFSRVINLAAQAGVRHSISHPKDYIDSNLVGFSNILECCRQHQVGHLVFASSSSVYGLNTRLPFSVHQNVDHPISLYAASKKANELMAHSYSYLYDLPSTGLRFFTVYGPWGRPDMALFLFCKNILAGRPIQVFNNGRMQRDFTYIDDIVEGIVRVMDTLPRGNTAWSGDAPDPSSSPAPYKLYNIGNNNSVELEDFIRTLERALGRTAIKEYHPLQPGDVPATFADIDDLDQEVGFRPKTSIVEGIPKFVEWYQAYYPNGYQETK